MEKSEKQYYQQLIDKQEKYKDYYRIDLLIYLIGIELLLLGRLIYLIHEFGSRMAIGSYTFLVFVLAFKIYFVWARKKEEV